MCGEVTLIITVITLFIHRLGEALLRPNIICLGPLFTASERRCSDWRCSDWDALRPDSGMLFEAAVGLFMAESAQQGRDAGYLLE